MWCVRGDGWMHRSLSCFCSVIILVFSLGGKEGRRRARLSSLSFLALAAYEIIKARQTFHHSAASLRVHTHVALCLLVANLMRPLLSFTARRAHLNCSALAESWELVFGAQARRQQPCSALLLRKIKRYVQGVGWCRTLLRGLIVGWLQNVMIALFNFNFCIALWKQ